MGGGRGKRQKRIGQINGKRGRERDKVGRSTGKRGERGKDRGGRKWGKVRDKEGKGRRRGG